MASTPRNQENAPKLRREMTLEEFDNGYFYAAELKTIAHLLGITVGNRRKFEVEELIRSFLRTGEVPQSTPTPARKKGESRDKLALDQQVINYVDDK